MALIIASAGRVAPATDSRRADRECDQTDWRQELPVLDGKQLTLRELRLERRARRCSRCCPARRSRVSFRRRRPRVDGVERFIAWTPASAPPARYVCFGSSPHGMTEPLASSRCGRPTRFRTAEWGFALGSAYWGRRPLLEAAQLVLDFAFEVIGVHRLEARAAVQERPRQRRAAQARCGPGGDPAALVPPQRRVPRPGAVDDPRFGSAQRAGRRNPEPRALGAAAWRFAQEEW